MTDRAEDFDRAREAIDESAGAHAYCAGQWIKAYWTEAKRRGWTNEKQRQEESKRNG